MGLDDDLDRVERRRADDRAAYSEQNADRLSEELVKRDAEQAFEHAVSTQIMPVFKRATARLSGSSVERPYGRDIQLAVTDETHTRPKQSLWYRLADEGQVMTGKLTMDGNAEGARTLPLTELTQETVEADLKDFLAWSIRS